MTTNIGTKDIDFSLINDALREAFLVLGEVKELHTSFMSGVSISDMTTQLIELGGTVFGDESDTQSILDTSIVISGIPIYGFPSDGSSSTGSGKFGPIFKNPDAGTPNYVCIFNGSGHIKFSFFDINDDGNYSHVTRGYYPSSNNLTASEINNYINNISYSDLPGIFSYSKLGSTYNDTAFTYVNDSNDYYKLQYLITKPLQLFSSEIEIIDPDYDSNQITYSGNNSTGGRLNDNTANWEGKDSEIDDNYDDHKKWYQIKVSENSDELKNIVGVSIKNVQNNVKKWKFYSVNHKIPEWGIAHNIGPVIDNPNQIINKSSSENWHKALFSKSCLFYNKNKVQGFRFTLTHPNDSSYPDFIVGLINKGSQGIHNAFRFFQYGIYLRTTSSYMMVYETKTTSYHNWNGGTKYYFGTNTNVDSGVQASDNDIFEVRVIDRTVSYLKNNKTVYTSSKPAKFPLYLGFTTYKGENKGVNLELYGDWCVPIPNKRLTFTQSFNSTDYKNVIWNKDIDIGAPTYVGLDEIKKPTSFDEWNSFVVSRNHIYRNDNEWQGFKFKANSVAASNDGGVMCGLGNRSTVRPISSGEWLNKDSTSADDVATYKLINYAMFLYGTNGLCVYETGGNRIDPSPKKTYTSDKEMEVRVKGTRVEYLYDGNVFHRSTAPVKSFPLFIECSMSYQTGTGVKDFKLYGDWTLNESKDFFYGETDKNQYNIFFEEPISCNAIRFQPIEWDGSEPQAKMGLIATKNEIGDGSLQIYDPEYKYHYTNSANMIYLNGTSNSLGLYDKGRISEDDHSSAPVKYATSWVPNITSNENSFGPTQSSTTGGQGTFWYEINTTTNETARNIHGVVVKGGFGEEFIKVPSKSWTSSEDYCVSEGGHLLSIHSLTENNQQQSWRATQGSWGSYPWIGGISVDGWSTSITGDSRKNYFIWRDGTPMNYLGPSFSTNDSHTTHMHLYSHAGWGTYTSTQYGIGKIPKRGYVKKWKFQYLDSNDEWQYVDNENIFSIASNGWNISNQIEFSKSVFAKKIRFIPWEWDTICAARMGLLIRDEINIGESFRNTSIINNSQYKKDIVMDLNTSISFSNILWDKNNSSSYMDFYDDGSIETNRTSYINLGHGNDYWPAIAMSTEIIHYDPNNYQSITFQKKTLASGFIIGLSQNHTGNDSYEDWNGGIHRYGHIDFGLVVRENSHANSLEIYERVRSPSSSSIFNNVDAAKATSPETTLDDIFEIRVKGTTVEYLKNGTVFYTSEEDARFPLYVRTAISTAGGGIKNIQLNRSHFPDTALPELTWNSSLSSGIKYENDGFTRNITGNDDNACAISNNVFYYNNDPHVKIIQGVRFRVTHSDVHLFIGFGDNEWGNGDKRLDMKFILHIRSNNDPSISVYNTESISSISESFQTDAYSPEDIFEIRITDTTVHYLKNNKIFYTDTTTATFPLYLKAFINSENKGLNNMEIFKTVLPSIGNEASQSNLTWNTGNSVDINFDNFSNDGSITPLSLTSSWESRTISEQVIHYNPNEYQGIRFKLNEINKAKAIGLGVDTNWEGSHSGINHYNAIHFAGYFTDENKYRIYESNPKLGVSSSNTSVARVNINNADFASNISTSDIFEIRVIGYTVEYLRNDEVYYTSENKATFPLYVKACLYNGGFKDIYLYTKNESNLYMEHTLNFNNEEKALIDNIVINDSDIAKQVNRFSIFGYNDENLNIAFDPVFDPPYTHCSQTYINNNSSMGDSSNGSDGSIKNGTWFGVSTSSEGFAGGRTLVTNGNTTHWYQIDYSVDGLDKTLVAGVVTYGRKHSTVNQYVTKWKFQYSSDGSTWEWVDDGYEFDGNTDKYQRNMIYFASPVNTTGIRFFATGYTSHPAARMALLLHIPNNKWEIIKHFSATDRNRLYYIDNEWKYKSANISHQDYVDNSTKVKLLFNIAKSYNYYKLIYKKYKNDTYSNNNNIEIYGAKIDENKLLVELIEPIKNLTLNSNFVINSNMAGEILSNLTLSSSSSINVGNNTITFNENSYGEYNDKWIKVTSGSHERKIIIPNFVRVQSSNIASTTNWIKVDNCINGGSGNQNVAITSEAGWGVGDDGSSGPFHPPLSSNADQIIKIKDWIENENINNYGYIYYICFSFLSSEPSRPQIFYRTNGENDPIYNVKTGTASNNSWEFHYIGSVFDLPNGVGNPLQGKLLYDIIPSSYTSQYFQPVQPDNSIKVLYNGGLTFRFNTTSISGNYPTSSTTTSYPWKFSSPITTPSTNDEIVNTISSSNKMFSTVGTNSPTSDSVSNATHNRSSLIKLEVISENGYKIHWNVSSESGYDHFYMLTSQDNNSWTSREYRRSYTQSGTVTVTSDDKYVICVYSKDGSVDSRNDAGYFYISFN